MSKARKSLPAFRSEAEERRFWETHDSADYVDWSKAERVRLPNLKPSTKSISLRLPEGLGREKKHEKHTYNHKHNSFVHNFLPRGMDEIQYTSFYKILPTFWRDDQRRAPWGVRTYQ